MGYRCRGNDEAVGFADEVGLADLDAVVPQDVVGSRDVEVEVRVRVAEQVLHALETALAAAHREHDLLFLAAVDLGRRHRLDEVDGLGDAAFQLGEGLLDIVVLRNLDARKARDRAFGAVAGDLHLAREREHVGIEAKSGDRRGIDLLRRAVRVRLLDERGEVAQHVGKARRRSLIH
jgi:hypothetical protein